MKAEKKPKIRIYISSTFEDLEDYRKKVIEMLEKSGDDVECMEKYAATDNRPLDKCRQDASNCDIYVGILGWRYGFIPEKDNPNGKSITELEYEAAPSGKKLVFQLKEGTPWNPQYMDSFADEVNRDKKIKNFRSTAADEAINDFFISPDDLASKVLAAVRRLDRQRRSVTIPHQDWSLQEYAKKLELRFFDHLDQQEGSVQTQVKSSYIEVQVRKRIAGKEDDAEPRPLFDWAAQPGLKALVIGDGGSGKTSLLLKLAYDSCRNALTNKHAALPFFVRLNFFDTNTDVLNGLLKIISREAGISRDELFNLWSDGSRRCIFLLDGLNEVRPEFSCGCRLAIQQLIEHTPHTCLISSRVSDQAAELKREIGSLVELEVLQLDTEQIKSHLQKIGADELAIEGRLLSLAQNPFLLWAIYKSCIGLSEQELPRNIGQLYKNLIDGYIFGKREVSKPKESRPTRYNYLLVKKVVLAQLAIDMCLQGATRLPENDTLLKSIRNHLYELRDSNAGIRLLKPHEFMPEPFAVELIEECTANGVLRRSGDTLEFMHESVRDYFAAVGLSKWPIDKAMQNIAPLIWRHVEPEYNELHLENTLEQAVIMSAGLRVDPTSLLKRLIDHHPLLAAHCFAATDRVGSQLEESLARQWLSLLDRRLTRYRWVGCQCLRVAKVSTRHIANRLIDLINHETEWQVEKSAAQALAKINDQQLTKEIVEQAINNIPEHNYSEKGLGRQFRYLQTDMLIVELLLAWGNRNQTGTRKRRIEYLFAKMRRTSVREVLQRLANETDNIKTDRTRVPELAQAALEVLDTWKGSILHAQDLRDSRPSYARQFQKQIRRWSEEISAWALVDVIRALKDPCAEKRAAAASYLATNQISAIPELIEATAYEQHGRVIPVLTESLRAFNQPDMIYDEWQKRVLDPRWLPLFSVGLDFVDDLVNRNPSEWWVKEFNDYQCKLEERSYITSQDQGWVIQSGSYRYSDEPIYWLRQFEKRIEVFDARKRPRLVAIADVFGVKALPVLKELLSEKDEFLQIEVAEMLGKIATPEAIALLSSCLKYPEHHEVIKVAIEGLERTQSKQAVQPLIDSLRTANTVMSKFGVEIGSAIASLDGVSSLIQFALETEMLNNEYCRLATISALGSCGQRDLEIEELLLKAAKDTNVHVRRASVVGLSRIKSLNAQEALLTICLDDVDEINRAESGEALRYFLGDAGVPKLVSTLVNGKGEICIRAVEALSRIQDDTAIPVLAKMMRSDAPLSQIIASAKALDTLGFDKEEVLKVLCLIAQTAPDVTFRQEAAKVLRGIPGGEEQLYQPINEGLNNNSYDEVIRLIGTDVPFLPDDLTLYWCRGISLHALKRNQEALEDFDRVVASDSSALVHRVRSQVLADLNRFSEAMAAAEKATEIEPKESKNHFFVGLYAFRLDEMEKSIAANRQALELNSNLAEAEFNLGLVLLISEQVLEATNAYNRGIALCIELNNDSTLKIYENALEELNTIVLERPQCAPDAEEAKTLLQNAFEASFH